MRVIVVPIPFGSDAMVAARYAADLSRAIGAKLEFVEMKRLKEYCEREQPFLVVADPGEAVPVLFRLPYPLLVVPAKACFQGVRRVAIACDREDIFSGVSAVLPFLSELNHLLGTAFEAVHVLVSGASAGTVEQEYAGWKRELPELGKRLHLVREEEVALGVQEFLAKEPVDWLLVLPKRHAMLEFHRSASRELVLGSAVPVMSVHE